MAKGNKPGHRRFGNIRRLPSGRYQASYLGPDGRRRYAAETFWAGGRRRPGLGSDRSSDRSRGVDRSQRGRVKLAEYAATWIAERPKLRPRSVDNYRWLLKKHIGSASARCASWQAVHADDQAVAG
jgi:hypothetical protein